MLKQLLQSKRCELFEAHLLVLYLIAASSSVRTSADAGSHDLETLDVDSFKGEWCWFFNAFGDSRQNDKSTTEVVLLSH